MSIISKIFAGLAGLIHVLFFLMESIFWNNPKVYTTFTVSSTADAQVIDLFIKNQGFYNLFLALGMFAGLAFIGRNKIIGQTLIVYTSLFMIGAAIVLFFTVPAMLSGVFIQGLPPVIVLATLLLNRDSNNGV